MKSIELMNNRSDSTATQTLSQRPLTGVEGIMEAFPSEDGFLKCERYNPDGQTRLCCNVRDCWFGGHPTLCQLDEAYHKPVGEAWLIPQLANISEYAGTKDKLTKAQIMECAFVIRTTYGYLKVSKFMLFCHRFKAGFYGDFFGAVSPLTITTALRQFLDDRAVAIEHHEQEKREAQLEEEKKSAVSYEEYCRMRGITASTSPIGQILNKFSSTPSK